MKKKHLASIALSCVMATTLMVGATYAPQTVYTNPPDTTQSKAAIADAGDAVYDEATGVSALVNQVATEQASAKAEAEAQAQAEAEKEAADASSSRNAVTSNKSQSSNYSKASNSSSSTATSTRTITVGGVTMSYVDSYGASTAPSSGAGVWKGSDSTTDGSYSYFIGHNPGSFSAAASIGNGSQVTVNDSNGDSRTYTVVDTFVVSRDSTWGDISDRVTGHGESIALQTCVDDGYRIVVAE